MRPTFAAMRPLVLWDKYSPSVADGSVEGRNYWSAVLPSGYMLIESPDNYRTDAGRSFNVLQKDDEKFGYG